MSKLYKHPRIYHAPWSENLQNDDRKHPNMDVFNNSVVVVTEKLDGENTTMYSDAIHARSIDSQNSNHPSRDMVKSLWGNINYAIKGIRICGENLYALHSIQYNNLDSYFYVFSTWEDNLCHSWDGTLNVLSKISELTGIELNTVPVIYYGIYNQEKIHSNWNEYRKHTNSESEGYVIRTMEAFNFDFENETFFTNIAKFVRKNHVQTNQHWLRTWDKTKINKLKDMK